MTMTKPTSEQITNIAAGAGAVQRTVEEKFRDIVSVKDFGAVGDGVADDTAAFLAAIATIPAANSITIGTDGMPSAASKTVIDVPAGIYKITQPLLFTNKAACLFRGTADTGLSQPAAVVLAWYGAAGQPLIHIDGGIVSLEQLNLRGRGISGYGVLFTRSNVGYVRGLSFHNAISITGFTIAGIQFGLADYVNLDQTDNLVFNNICIHSCYDGIVSVNRNNLNIQINNLSIISSYPYGGIAPRQGIRILKGGMDVYGYYPGGFVGSDFSDYCIYLEDGYVNVYGGYTETEKFIRANEPNPSGATVTSTIVGFDHYPATLTGGVGAIDWNQEGNTLSWYGGRAPQNIVEGANSGGICFTNTRFFNNVTWTGRTWKSACVNCNVIRTATPGESYQLNWLGKSASEACYADADLLISNNLQMRDSVIARYVNQESVAMRMLAGELRLYHAPSGGSGIFNQNYSSFNEFFRAGYSSAEGRWHGNGTNRVTWGAAVPTTGTWAQGDVRWNTGATAGGSPGWVCTTAGTPGTWKAMANVAP